MLPTFELPAQNVLPVCAQVHGLLCSALVAPSLASLHFADLFSLHGHRLLPAITLLAVLAPGYRSRRQAPPSLEAQRPHAAKTLIGMRRDPNASFSMSTAGTSSMALEDGVEGHLLVHFTSSRGNLTISGGWLGAGRRRYVWLPLRPTLTWNSLDGPNVSSAEIAEVAADLHAGLEEMNVRHAIEEFFTPAPIPLEERRTVLDSYSSFMAAHGWQVTYDDNLTRRSLKRTDASESPQHWSTPDREALTRHEALVSEMLKGVRSSSRILFQTR